MTLVDGLISDSRPHRYRKKSKRGMVRLIHAQGAIPHRRQEDDGLRVSRAVRLELPRRSFHPTGGGVGLIGMWKAFEELEQLGWVRGKRPKMIAIQAAGIGRRLHELHEQHELVSQMWQNAATFFASGLARTKAIRRLSYPRHRSPVARDRHRTQRRTNLRFPAPTTGLRTKASCSPRRKDAAATAALVTIHLLSTGFLSPADRVVLFNTGSGNKYTDVLAQALGLKNSSFSL